MRQGRHLGATFREVLTPGVIPVPPCTGASSQKSCLLPALLAATNTLPAPLGKQVCEDQALCLAQWLHPEGEPQAEHIIGPEYVCWITDWGKEGRQGGWRGWNKEGWTEESLLCPLQRPANLDQPLRCWGPWVWVIVGLGFTHPPLGPCAKADSFTCPVGTQLQPWGWSPM